MGFSTVVIHTIEGIHINPLPDCDLFQDGLEFSSPRIHTPFYNIDETCNPYAKDDKLFLETFQRHFNQPLEGGTSVRSSALLRAATGAPLWAATLAFVVSLLLV